MENRGSKGLALAALLVGVVGLTIGFAAFTAQLTIKPEATVGTTYDVTTFQAAFGFADDYAKSWTPSVTFSQTGTAPSENPVETASKTIKNDSAYPAYTATTSGDLTVVKCTAGEGATDALVQKACLEISGTYTLPGTVPANGTAEASVTVKGPKTQVDGPFTVEFAEIKINYTTAG